MAVIKKLPQPSLNNQRRNGAPQKSEWRFVVYFIAQDCSIAMGLDYMPMPPPPKRTLDLDVLEQVWPIINGVFRNPTHRDRAEDPGLYYRLAANF